MRALLSLACASLWNRRASVALTIFSVATSFALLISVERLHASARTSFETTISGTDLILGARGSNIQLLLYSVFRLGEPVQEMSWESYEEISAHPEVEWSVPLALGDSVHGYRVLGTTADYFKHYRYGSRTALQLNGRTFENRHDAVLGSEVAAALGWSLGSRFPIHHGVAKDAHEHDELDFEVVGILSPTGTPVDRTVHVALDGLALVHHEAPENHRKSAQADHEVEQGHVEHHVEQEHEHDELQSISAALVGLRSKLGLFRMRAWVNNFRDEPLMAIMPARAFQQLWATVSIAEQTLRVIGLLVSFAGIVALVAALLSTLNERRREMALLRSVGASPSNIAALIIGEAVLVALASVVAAIGAVFAAGLLGQETLLSRFGLRLGASPLTLTELPWVFAFVLAAALVALIPAAVGYRRSLSDGLLVRS